MKMIKHIQLIMMRMIFVNSVKKLKILHPNVIANQGLVKCQGENKSIRFQKLI
jgi:hypothetical protein